MPELHLRQMKLRSLRGGAFLITIKKINNHNSSSDEQLLLKSIALKKKKVHCSTQIADEEVEL